MHLRRRLKCTIVIIRCPSSVCPSSLTFHIFNFSSEENLRKLDRKQDLNVLYQVCVFWADRKNKMAALASDWLRHFRLFLWNLLTEFNKSGRESRSQRPLPTLCCSGYLQKQDGRPSLWSAETFSTSPLKQLNRIQRNLTGTKISNSCTKFVFIGLIGKTKWLPQTLIGWDIFNFSSKNGWMEFNKTWQKSRSQHPLPSLNFSGRFMYKNGRYGQSIKRLHIVLRCTLCGPLGLLFYFSFFLCIIPVFSQLSIVGLFLL